MPGAVGEIDRAIRHRARDADGDRWRSRLADLRDVRFENVIEGGEIIGRQIEALLHAKRPRLGIDNGETRVRAPDIAHQNGLSLAHGAISRSSKCTSISGPRSAEDVPTRTA